MNITINSNKLNSKLQLNSSCFVHIDQGDTLLIGKNKYKIINKSTVDFLSYIKIPNVMIAKQQGIQHVPTDFVDKPILIENFNTQYKKLARTLDQLKNRSKKEIGKITSPEKTVYGIIIAVTILIIVCCCIRCIWKIYKCCV